MPGNLPPFGDPEPFDLTRPFSGNPPLRNRNELASAVEEDLNSTGLLDYWRMALKRKVTLMCLMIVGARPVS